MAHQKRRPTPELVAMHLYKWSSELTLTPSPARGTGLFVWSCGRISFLPCIWTHSHTAGELTNITELLFFGLIEYFFMCGLHLLSDLTIYISTVLASGGSKGSKGGTFLISG